MARKWWKFALGLLIALILAMGIKGFFFGPSDEELIKQALEETVAAAAQGEPSIVLDNLSSKFTYGSQIPFPGDISKAVRLSKPKVSILYIDPVIEGEQAVVKSPVTIEMAFMSINLNETVPDVKITLEKEWGLKYLFMPTPRWRIVDVSAPSLPEY